MLMWVAFVFSLFAALAEIPPDQWWAELLWLGGAVLLLFLWVRMVIRPLIPPAKWLGGLVFRLVPRVWQRLVVWKRRSNDRDETEGE